MSHHRGTFRTALAGVFLLVSLTAFALSFYFLDGWSLVSPLAERAMGLWDGLTAVQSTETPVSNAPGQLVLPLEMDEDFALRIWQEQMDSQRIIEELVAGEVKSLSIDKVTKTPDEATLKVRVTMVDGTYGPGEIKFRKFGPDWYVASATGMRSLEATGLSVAMRSGDEPIPVTPLPDKSEVDAELLNTILAEQRKSQSVIGEYLSGIVKKVDVEGVVTGPKTVTIDLVMRETHGTATAKIVTIQSEHSGEKVWFIARFAKTGSDH